MLEPYVEDDIQVVKLNNPKTNPINLQMLEQLHEIIQTVNNNPTPKGLILTGEGRFFSSGFDLPIFINFKDLDEATAFFAF